MLVIDCPNNRKIKVTNCAIYLNDEVLDNLGELTEDERERLFMSMAIMKDRADGTA